MRAVIDLATLIEGVGVELRPAGPGRLRGLCPFHQEDTASFFVFENRQRGHCFGCGWSGDAIDFIRKSRGCSFPEALKILGVDDPKWTAVELARIRAEKSRRDKERWRERELAWTLGTAIRRAYAMLPKLLWSGSDSFNLLLHELSILEYQHDLLINGEAADKSALVAELRGLRLFYRRLLFRRDFDFTGWCRSTLTGVPNGEGRNRRTKSDRGGRLQAA